MRPCTLSATWLILGGFLLNATGFDVDLGGHQAERTITLMRIFDAFLPMLTSAVAIWAIASYPITEEATLSARQKNRRVEFYVVEPAPAQPLPAAVGQLIKFGQVHDIVRGR